MGIGHNYFTMVTITVADRETEKQTSAFLLGRLSGGVLRSGERLVPEAALETLADQPMPFTHSSSSGQGERFAEQEQKCSQEGRRL